MTDRLWGLAKRCSVALVAVGAVTTSVVGLGYVCKEKVWSWQREQMEKLLRNSHLDQHNMQHYHNVTSTLLGYLETLRQRIDTCCDTDDTIRRLKNGSISKIEGWQLLKKQTFTKLLLTLHSSSLLFLFVSIQLTVVSANIFLNITSLGDPTNNTTKVYLAKIAYLLDFAVPDIARICEAEVERVMSDTNLDSKLGYGDILVHLDSMNVATSLNLPRLCRIDLGDQLRDEMLRNFVLQTLDIVDSQDFRYTYLSLVARNRDYLCKEIFSVVKQDDVVVAKLLPGLTKIPVNMVTKQKEEFVVYALECGHLKNLSRNLYQALTT